MPHQPKVDWSNPGEARAYRAQYIRERRRAGLVPMNWRRDKKVVVGKRDIFEVAAQLAKALTAITIESPPHNNEVANKVSDALAAYREYWEKD